MSHLQLLPNGMQQFFDSSGNPLALGTVGMYVPNTLTFKDNWQDSGHSALNSDPIVLDAAGRCVIWGSGTYRQLLKDVNGNTIWDKLTLVSDIDSASADLTFITVDDESSELPNSRRLIAGAGIAIADGGAGGDIEVSATGSSTAGLGLPGHRLSPQSGSAVVTANVSGATSVFYVPYLGNSAPIPSPSEVSLEAQSFSEISQALNDSTRSPAAAAGFRAYDCWLWYDGVAEEVVLSRGPGWSDGGRTFTVTIASPGVFTLNSHAFFEGQPVVFTTSGALPTGLTAETIYYIISAGLTANAFQVSATAGGSAVNTSGSQSGVHTATTYVQTRGTGAGSEEHDTTTFPGYYVNKYDITNGPEAGKGLFVGSILTNASSTLDYILGGVGAAGGEGTIQSIWNLYNEQEIELRNFDNTDSWTYTTATDRIKNNSYNNRIQFFQGLATRPISAVNAISNNNNTTLVGRHPTVALRSTTNPIVTGNPGNFSSANNDPVTSGAGVVITLEARWNGYPGIGFGYLAPTERSVASGTTNWYGDNGATIAAHFSLFTASLRA